MNKAQPILPSEPVEAVKAVLKLVERLMEVMEQEGRAMTMHDSVAFTAAQDEKQRLSAKYQQACAEFQARLMDFRAVDKAWLDKLDSAQRALKAKAEENSVVMERMKA